MAWQKTRRGLGYINAEDVRPKGDAYFGEVCLMDAVGRITVPTAVLIERITERRRTVRAASPANVRGRYGSELENFIVILKRELPTAPVRRPLQQRLSV